VIANCGDLMSVLDSQLKYSFPFQVGKFIQLTATFVGGFAVAFSKGWLLAAVMMSSVPPIVVAGAAISWTVSKLASQGQAKYNEAGIVVEQTIGAIRTVDPCLNILFNPYYWFGFITNFFLG
jgi:ABC-type multidrug transport system fused ATPase/permease subunit